MPVGSPETERREGFEARSAASRGRFRTGGEIVLSRVRTAPERAVGLVVAEVLRAVLAGPAHGERAAGPHREREARHDGVHAVAEAVVVGEGDDVAAVVAAALRALDRAVVRQQGRPGAVRAAADEGLVAVEPRRRRRRGGGDRGGDQQRPAHHHAACAAAPQPRIIASESNP
jgi:hypothetical protein